MKKTLATMAMVLALGGNSLSALDMPALTLDAKIGFETEYVERGRKEGKQNFQMAAELGMPFLGGQVYAGASSVLMLEDILIDGDPMGSLNQVHPYVGFSHDVVGWFTADLGIAANLYTNGSETITRGWGFPRNTTEVYVGAMVDVPFTPKGYLSYDFDREELDMVLSANYSYDLGTLGLSHLVFEGNGFFGYNYTKRPYGIKNFFASDGGLRPNETKDYFYFGLGADLVYKYNEQASIKAGVRYSTNGNSKQGWVNSTMGLPVDDGVLRSRNLVWFAGSVEFSF